MPWRACSGKDNVEISQAGVKKRADRVQMPDGGNAPDGKPGLCADQCGISFAQWLARQCAGLGRINLITACGDE